MSKIRIDIDTEKKTLSVVKDGEALEDVSHVSCSSDECCWGFSCNISMEAEEDGGMKKYTSLNAQLQDLNTIYEAIAAYDKDKERK